MKRTLFRNKSIGNTLVAIPLIRVLKQDSNAETDVVVDHIGYDLSNTVPI